MHILLFVFSSVIFYRLDSKVYELPTFINFGIKKKWSLETFVDFMKGYRWCKAECPSCSFSVEKVDGDFIRN